MQKEKFKIPSESEKYHHFLVSINNVGTNNIQTAIFNCSTRSKFHNLYNFLTIFYLSTRPIHVVELQNSDIGLQVFQNIWFIHHLYY